MNAIPEEGMYYGTKYELEIVHDLDSKETGEVIVFYNLLGINELDCVCWYFDGKDDLQSARGIDKIGDALLEDMVNNNDAMDYDPGIEENGEERKFVKEDPRQLRFSW